MYLLSKDVISFLFFPIYITMDTSILIAWKKKERECDDKVKELHCKHSQLKKVQNNLACVAGAKRGRGRGEGEPPSPFSLPPYPLSPTPFDACYAG